jgi:hypothetical protein
MILAHTPVSLSSRSERNCLLGLLRNSVAIVCIEERFRAGACLDDVAN